MNIFVEEKSGLVGLLISGSVFLVLEVFEVYTFHNSSSPFLLLLSLVMGFAICNLIRVTSRNFRWLRGGLIISLFYLPIFLAVVNDDPMTTFGITQIAITLPGYDLLIAVGGGKYFGSYPHPTYFIAVSLAGLITLMTLFLISSTVGLIWKQTRPRVHH